MSIPRRSVQLAGDRTLIAGLEKHFKKGSLHVAGKIYTVTEIVKLLKARVAVAETVETVKTTLHDAVKEEEKEIASTQEFVEALVLALRAVMGAASPSLSDFGLAPRKKAPALTSEQLVARAKKGAATRKARHTMSAKQKKAIKGVVTPETAPPVTAPAVSPLDGSGNGVLEHDAAPIA